jgi:hypothetical protein
LKIYNIINNEHVYINTMSLELEFEKMKLTDLKDYCKNNGIKGVSKMKKN